MYKAEEISLQIYHFVDYSTGSSAGQKSRNNVYCRLEDCTVDRARSGQAQTPGAAWAWRHRISYRPAAARSRFVSDAVSDVEN